LVGKFPLLFEYTYCSSNGVKYKSNYTIDLSFDTPSIPKIIITTPSIDICTSTPISFKSYCTGNIKNIKIYWVKNSQLIDSGFNYTFASLNNNDTIWAKLISSNYCPMINDTTVISNKIIVKSKIWNSPEANIIGPKDTVCTGSKIKLTALMQREGNNPILKCMIV
jgi:hypothetical protein